MTVIGQNTSYYLEYQDIAKQQAKEYYVKNKEKIKEMQREKYESLSIEEKKNLVSRQKEWFNRQTKEKQDEMRRKAREYSKNRYYNHIVVVN